MAAGYSRHGPLDDLGGVNQRARGLSALTTASVTDIGATGPQTSNPSATGIRFIERRVEIRPGPGKTLFSLPVSAPSRHLVGGTLIVDGPGDVDLTLELRLLNASGYGHFLVQESKVAAVHVTGGRGVAVPVRLGGPSLLVPVTVKGWCSIEAGRSPRVQVVAARENGDGGAVTVRGGWLSCITPPGGADS